MMGNRLLYKIECFHVFGMHESERLKVTALNLFHPTASPPFQKVSFFYYDTVSKGRGEITFDNTDNSPGGWWMEIKGQWINDN
jgi:hypothetical protein